MGSRYELRSFEDPAEFLRAIKPFLEEHEAENSLLIGLLGAFRPNPLTSPPQMLEVTDTQRTEMVAFFSGVSLILTRGDLEAITLVVDALLGNGISVPGVVGPPEQVRAFSETWCNARGCQVKSVANQRIYECRKVNPPRPTEGSFRTAESRDFELLFDWSRAFNREAVPDQPFIEESARRNLADRIGNGRMFVWEVDGEVVSMCGASRPTKSTMTVNAVYTPFEKRSKGYAGAVVAEVTRKILSDGFQSAVLYTDLSNPVSNSIYMRIGYTPVCDSENRWFRYTP